MRSVGFSRAKPGTEKPSAGVSAGFELEVRYDTSGNSTREMQEMIKTVNQISVCPPRYMAMTEKAENLKIRLPKSLTT